MIDSNWRIGARSNVSGLSKTQTLKNFPRQSESWEQVKDGWETIEKYRECARILEQPTPHPRTGED